MRKYVGLGLALVFLSTMAWSAEVGLVTALSGSVCLQEGKAASRNLQSFIKLRELDRLTLHGNTRLQIVFFDSGRQETWRGAGLLEVGSMTSQAIKGDLQVDVKTLPAMLVKQLAKTPTIDGIAKSGMLRLRTLRPELGMEMLEKNYADLRNNTDASDHAPDLYLLASYFELREFSKVEAALKTLTAAAPGDTELALLSALYVKSIEAARASE